MSADGVGGESGGAVAGGGPCGACKFLRRKCVKGCIFAPYFDSDQGTAHFAAVHRVFGASNASKLLLRIPPHSRLDAVVTLCYEALARVVNLQAELAYTHARISTLQHAAPLPPPQLSSSSLRSSTAQTTLFDDETSPEMVSFCNSVNQEVVEDGDLQYLAREYVSRYFPGVRFRPPASD
ncbi:LOB domain-containing protein 19 [Phtheirospermum japonicum]|uniref:LOB domain-containing protein 19 n=1 Tax=Phtheirospermum japonicum TaxID=374723 RepID=A0A830B5Q6_9LAMI|nr:LOB domain-containing protein 19 [Phtheirospermum japonicum]